MRGTYHRPTGKSFVAVLCAACFLATTLGSVPRAAAADTWNTWPRKAPAPEIEKKPDPVPDKAGKTWKIWPEKPAEPGMPQIPAAGASRAAGDEDEAERKSGSGRSYGTIGWIALGVAAAIGVAIAVGGGGGGDGGGTVTNPGHQ